MENNFQVAKCLFEGKILQDSLAWSKMDRVSFGLPVLANMSSLPTVCCAVQWAMWKGEGPNLT